MEVQMLIAKNTVFHGFFIFRLHFNLPAGPKMPDLVPLYFTYIGSVHYLKNLIVLEPKISRKKPILANFCIFWLF